MTSAAPVLGLVGCALMFGVSVTSSQALVRAHDPALQIAIEARDKSFITRDVAEWSKYTAEDYLSVSDEGAISGKQERLRRLQDSTSGSQTPHVMDSIRMFGTDTAVTIEHGTSTRITYVWIRQSGTWRVVSAQSTPITKK